MVILLGYRDGDLELSLMVILLSWILMVILLSWTLMVILLSWDTDAVELNDLELDGVTAEGTEENLDLSGEGADLDLSGDGADLDLSGEGADLIYQVREQQIYQVMEQT